MKTNGRGDNTSHKIIGNSVISFVDYVYSRRKASDSFAFGIEHKPAKLVHRMFI